MKKYEELFMEAIAIERDKIIQEEVDLAVSKASLAIHQRMKELTQKVSIEIARRFEVVDNETTITVKYKP